MKEFFDGSGIYWYSSQRSICSACTKWEEFVNLAVDIFFSKEVLRISCARGLNKGRQLKDTVPLCQPIVEAIIGKFPREMSLILYVTLFLSLSICMGLKGLCQFLTFLHGSCYTCSQWFSAVLQV